MIRHITVAVDDREQADDAVALARVLARATRAELDVVAAYPPRPLSARVPTEGRGRWSRGRAEAALNRARAAMGPSVAASFHAHPSGSPEPLLREWAEEAGSDLLVLGSSHRGPVGRTLLGGVAQRLARDAPCAVAVAPRGYAAQRDHGLRRIGVAWVDSPEARAALAGATDLAAAARARLAVIHASEPRSDEDRRRARAALDAVVAEPSRRVIADGVLVAGSPADGLVARSGDLDLLFLGSRGYGPVRHVLLGGVSRDVMHEAACPIVVVPRSAVRAAARDGAGPDDQEERDVA